MDGRRTRSLERTILAATSASFSSTPLRECRLDALGDVEICKPNRKENCCPNKLHVYIIRHGLLIEDPSVVRMHRAHASRGQLHRGVSSNIRTVKQLLGQLARNILIETLRTSQRLARFAVCFSGLVRACAGSCKNKFQRLQQSAVAWATAVAVAEHYWGLVNNEWRVPCSRVNPCGLAR
ncbi:hypothetical protein ACCAA_1390006 [Candidatus Accumulibacter aalborgensis]|uniref:Uncharacterized protein n=1 Tax=Candidatus Accumulibacter aalborgensis TaxID=1860102 RepID=A0A1A8XJ82_9PROT|nr:hypothetical protein ACCAA_1390006 [Candidatus Accumulibacter aalborgensis]